MRISNCFFFNNTNPDFYGGAIKSTQSTLVIKSSTFANNTAGGKGGAIYAESGADVEIYNCIFRYNKVIKASQRSDSGGGGTNDLDWQIDGCPESF